MGGEGDLSLPTNMISLMSHCHGESCALYSRLRCGTGVSPLLPPPFTYREGATVSRALEFMHGSSGLGYFLSFFGSETPTQYLWIRARDCPGPVPTLPCDGKIARGPCFGAGKCGRALLKRTVSRFVSAFVVRNGGVGVIQACIMEIVGIEAPWQFRRH